MPDFHDCALCVKSRPMLMLLSAWGAYSFGIQSYLKPLNKITVPVLEMPLGVYLAMQGALIVFAVLVVWFARRRPVAVAA